jgi:hypothetical protein
MTVNCDSQNVLTRSIGRFLITKCVFFFRICPPLTLSQLTFFRYYVNAYFHIKTARNVVTIFYYFVVHTRLYGNNPIRGLLTETSV